MKTKIFLCIAITLMCTAVHAEKYACTPQEWNVYLSDSTQILHETKFNTEEMIVRWKKRYVIPQKKFDKFEHFVRTCEFRKVCQNHLYADSLQKRIESKMATEDIYRDSIYKLLIPVCENGISGENICRTLKMAKLLKLDDSQYSYLMDKALDMAHRMEKSRSLNVWNEEINLLRSTLSNIQLSMYFYNKNAQAAKKDVEAGWSRLEKADLTEDLDSVKDKRDALRYYQELRKIKDIYRYYGTSQKKYLAELNKRMPKVVLMLDALDKKARIVEERKKNGTIGKEFAW